MEGPHAAEMPRRLKDVLHFDLAYFLEHGSNPTALLLNLEITMIEAAAYAACADPEGPDFLIEDLTESEGWPSEFGKNSRIYLLDRESRALAAVFFKTSKGGSVRLTLEGTPARHDTLEKIGGELGINSPKVEEVYIPYGEFLGRHKALRA